MLRTFVGLLALSILTGLVEADEVLYTTSIKPLLAAKCVSCHGPVKQEAGLRLDTAALVAKGGDDGAVIVRHRPTESRLLARIRSADPHERMPPEGEGEPLTAAQIELLATWIERGAVGPIAEKALANPKDHWAYQPPVKVPLPEDVAPEWKTNPVDQLLAEAHRAAGVTPVDVADKATLLRRVTFDLTGLPPTPDELHEFLADDSPSAWPRVVDRLLDSPAYGERWGRHWMDVWRYSDWDGYQKELRGSQRHIWRWRDWIIESLNADRGYDQMIREMLAADEIAPTDNDALRATGFLARNYYKFNRNAWLDHTVEHTAKAFLGMTLDCAKCHDHKYDPLSQKDFYTFRAIFEPHQIRTDQLPSQPNLELDGLPRAYDANLAEPTYLFVRGNDKQPDKEHPLTAAVPAVFETLLTLTPVSLPRETYYPALNPFVLAETRAAAKKAADDAEAALSKARESMSAMENTLEQARTATPGEPVSAQTMVAATTAWIDAEAAAELAQKRSTAATAKLPVLEARIAADEAKYRDPPAENFEALANAAARKEREQAKLDAELAVIDATAKWQQVRRSKAKPAAIEKAEKDRDAAVKKWDEAIAAVTKTDSAYTPLGTEYPRASTGRRSALANWITRPDHPLTARVAVNHVWHRHFGRPIVENVFDFGLRSPRPPLGDLLDWLAVDFVEHGWNFKHLHRTIVLSRAYRLATTATDEVAARNRTIDPDNLFRWKADLRRLEAEAVRDNVLAATGTLDRTVGGADIDYHDGEKVLRRSVYFRHAYEKQMTFLTTFDAASPNECYRRTESIVPQQALALANSSLVHAQATALAKTLETEAADEAFITAIYERILGRQPWDEERALCREFLAAGQSRRDLIHVLMNHNDFVTIR